MRVRSIRGEIINLENVRVGMLKDNELTIIDGERVRKYTLTEESTKKISTLYSEVE